MSLSFVFGMEADAVRFELPCDQECSSLWSPRKMVYRSDWTGVVLPVYPVKMGSALSLSDSDLFNTYTGFHRHQVSSVVRRVVRTRVSHFTDQGRKLGSWGSGSVWLRFLVTWLVMVCVEIA
jgi:hypothetical protein